MVNIPKKIYISHSKYILKTLLIYHVGFALIIYIANLSTSSTFGNQENISILSTFYVSSLTVIDTLIEFGSFIILLACFFCIRNLVLAKEIDILKATGLSIWQISIPFVTIGASWSLFFLLFLQPISAHLLKIKENLARENLEEKRNIFFDNQNFWLIDVVDIHNKNIIMSKQALELDDTIFLSDIYIMRVTQDVANTIIYAQEAKLDGTFLKLNNVIIQDRNSSFPLKQSHLTLELTFQPQIERLAPNINTTSIYQIPETIEDLSRLQINTTNYKQYFYNLVLSPLLSIIMVLVGFRFSLYDVRKSAGFYPITATIIFGYLIYLSNNVSGILAFSTNLPDIISAILGKSILLLVVIYSLIAHEGI